MKIYIGNDHRGVAVKRAIMEWLVETGHEVVNCGVDGDESVDYPDQAEDVAKRVVASPGSIGVLFCGTGTGMQMAANKIPGARAAQIWDLWIAEYAKRHNDANIITFSNDRQTHGEIKNLIAVYLESAFDGGRHERRVEKIKRLEEN